MEQIINNAKDLNHRFDEEDLKTMEIPEKVSKLEAIIYDWVYENFDHSEAEDPSWNISMLAEDIEEQLNKPYKQKHTVAYVGDGCM